MKEVPPPCGIRAPTYLIIFQKPICQKFKDFTGNIMELKKLEK
jgi:hypothetical protein